MRIDDSGVFKGPGCTSSGGECCSDPSCGISLTHEEVVSQEVDWPGCIEARLTHYDFHLRAGSAAVVEQSPTRLRSLAEKAKLAASVACILFADKDSFNK